mmetsp:Transcript_6008/g.17200  ORF Transcript_6008/g.17200 Transcript_6008/m.17200 type:complete len:203 (+) Transcript_6008:775-1383(+)
MRCRSCGRMPSRRTLPPASQNRLQRRLQCSEWIVARSSGCSTSAAGAVSIILGCPWMMLTWITLTSTCSKTLSDTQATRGRQLIVFGMRSIPRAASPIVRMRTAQSGESSTGSSQACTRQSALTSPMTTCWTSSRGGGVPICGSSAGGWEIRMHARMWRICTSRISSRCVLCRKQPLCCRIWSTARVRQRKTRRPSDWSVSW